MATSTTLTGPYGAPIPETRPAERGEESGVHAIEGCSQCDVEHLRGSHRCPARRLGHLVANKYHLLDLLGVGGMGAVYRARDLKLDVDVAVKMLHSRYANSNEVAERFRIEAQGASRLTHPGVVQIRDYGRDDDGCAFMVMELLEGRSLSEVIDDGPMPIEQAVQLMADALDTLHAAHGAGIVHRDLKPGNLFVVDAPDGPRMKLLDFGIAKVLDEGEAALTRTGVVMGTPQYMSPEQMMDAKRAGAQADVYSMGATLFEMLTGVPPVTADKPAALILRVANGEITRRPDMVRPGISPAIATVVERSLALLPSRRPRSAKAMGNELLSALSGAARTTWSREEAIEPAAVGPTDDANDDTLPPIPRPLGRRSGPLAFAMILSVVGALFGIGLLSLGGTAVDASEPATKSMTTPATPDLDAVTFSGSAEVAIPAAHTEAVEPEADVQEAAPARGATIPRASRPRTAPTPRRAVPSQQDLMIALNRIRPRLEQCFDGNAQVQFDAVLVGSTGRVQDVTANVPGASAAETACAYRALSGIRVSPFSERGHRAHGTVTITAAPVSAG